MARRFQLKGGLRTPGARAMDDDDVAAIFEDRPSDAVETELRSATSDLPAENQIDLVALLWLGRDEETADDWDEMRSAAASQHNERTADYLCRTPLLADHLLSGLEAIGRDCAASDADKL